MTEENMPSVAQTEEEVTPEVTEEIASETIEESIDEVRARLADEAEKRQKSDELANNYKIRAEKAEKANRIVPQPQAQVGLSSKDTVAIINAKVHEDDVDDVIEYAKFKKISIGEALKSSVIRASLKEKDEFRSTANATNTSRTRTPNSKASGESLLEKAQKTGELPDSDSEINSMLDARYQSKKK